MAYYTLILQVPTPAWRWNLNKKAGFIAPPSQHFRLKILIISCPGTRLAKGRRYPSLLPYQE